MTTAEHAGFTIGDTVTYKPTGETGRITNFSPNPRLAWVRYGLQKTSKATHLTDLERVQS